MAKQTFTTGQVLTAAQMTSLQQTAMLGGAASAKTASYTLVAADAGTAISMSSASATTITVNTGLFAAGDTVQITNLGAGVCTITAGTATVNSSASLALAQYESGTLDFTSSSAAIFIKGAGAAAASGGITLINRSTFSNVASHAIDNVFTSSYKSYVIKIESIYGASGGTMYYNYRYGGSSGTTATEATHYGYRSKGIYNNNTWDTGESFNGTTYIPIGDSCGTATYPFHSTIEVFNVGNTAQITTITFASNLAGGSGGIAVGGGTLYNQRNYTGFILTGGSNITGAVAVYGYGV